jgi:hypothetical protein
MHTLPKGLHVESNPNEWYMQGFVKNIRIRSPLKNSKRFLWEILKELKNILKQLQSLRF